MEWNKKYWNINKILYEWNKKNWNWVRKVVCAEAIWRAIGGRTRESAGT